MKIKRKISFLLLVLFFKSLLISANPNQPNKLNEDNEEPCLSERADVPDVVNDGMEGLCAGIVDSCREIPDKDKKKICGLNQLAKLLAKIFHQNKISWALQGSSSAMFAGATLTTPPGDLDVSVVNMAQTRDVMTLIPCLQDSSGQSLGVNTYRLRGTDLTFDLIDGPDFGIAKGLHRIPEKPSEISLLPVGEIIISTLLRPEFRADPSRDPKDIVIAFSLILKHQNELTEKEKDKIRVRIGAMNRNPNLFKNWNDLVTFIGGYLPKIIGRKRTFTYP